MARFFALYGVAIIFGAIVIAVLIYRYRRSSVLEADPEKVARLLLTALRMEQGRVIAEASAQQRSLYRTLGGEIDRVREIFLHRFPAHEAIFYHALVEVLADGNHERLGSEYPYPRF